MFSGLFVTGSVASETGVDGKKWDGMAGCAVLVQTGRLLFSFVFCTWRYRLGESDDRYAVYDLTNLQAYNKV